MTESSLARQAFLDYLSLPRPRQLTLLSEREVTTEEGQKLIVRSEYATRPWKRQTLKKWFDRHRWIQRAADHDLETDTRARQELQEQEIEERKNRRRRRLTVASLMMDNVLDALVDRSSGNRIPLFALVSAEVTDPLTGRRKTEQYPVLKVDVATIREVMRMYRVASEAERIEMGERTLRGEGPEPAAHIERDALPQVPINVMTPEQFEQLRGDFASYGAEVRREMENAGLLSPPGDVIEQDDGLNGR